MDTLNRSKLNLIYQNWPSNHILTTPRFHELGINNELIKSYVKSGWINRIGTGAFTKVGDSYNGFSAIEAIQSQQKIGVHIGGETAIRAQGISDQVLFDKDGHGIHIYSNGAVKLPVWFLNLSAKLKTTLHQDRLFNSSPKNSIQSLQIDQFSILTSCRERAILELINEVPKRFDFEAIYPLMVQLGTLRPSVLEELLVECNSIKVKRLFLYFARESAHGWYSKINQSKINLGTGKRVIVENGTLDHEFQITVHTRGEENK